MYDYVAAASKRLPADVRARIIAHEGSFGRGGSWEGGFYAVQAIVTGWGGGVGPVHKKVFAVAARER